MLNQILANSVAEGLAGHLLSTVDSGLNLPRLRWVTVIDQNLIGRTPHPKQD
ncbi:hypothetical protein [Crossiella sp. NPDC003009]